ncbi:MAG TPA: dTDP-4-amino-4,6-dideoxygalactose transaminase [Bdellovibrionales bacterium]|nr:dTDP-4-amino-4,6-dideoxygalactose transaminase [Bdellovibrionales bacterium]
MSKHDLIPFNRPTLRGKEHSYLQEALERGHFSGDGPFTKKCHRWLEENLNCKAALLTHSCTAALEMSAILSDIGPGDEVIMPSFTFVSTANAIALRGGVPVFVNVRPDTMNIDENEIVQAITKKTKAIFVVHYAGVSAEMDKILAIAKEHGLVVLEDAAQGLMSSYKGRALGTIGSLGSLSFHETKNVVSGEGGALLINDPGLKERAEIIREKGTNRSQFFRGQVDKYTWVDIGSSYLPSELLAAVLLAQLEAAREITSARLAIWNGYHESFSDLEKRGFVRRPIVPKECVGNGHIYFMLTRSLDERTELMDHLKTNGVASTFHYVPLHNSPGGLKYGKASGDLSVTVDLADRLVRLPLWAALTKHEQERVSQLVWDFYSRR